MNFALYENTLPYPDWTIRKTPEGKLMSDAYNIESCRLHQLFVSDLKAELGITDNPKADKLVSIAWEKGHSKGHSNDYSEVYSKALDLVDLIV